MLTLVIVVVGVLFLLYIGSKKPRGFPPGPPRLPLLGYIPFMEKDLIHKQLWRMSASYGPVIGLYFGGQPTVIVNGWEAIKESLLNDDLNGRPINVFTRMQFNNKVLGVMFVEGDFWKEQRRFSLHHFRNLGFGKRSHESVIHEEISELVQEIQVTEASISLQGKLGVSAINILWAMMGGTRFARSDPTLADLVSRLNKVFRAGKVTGSIVQLLPVLRHVVSKENVFNVVKSGLSLVVEFIKKAVKEHKATIDFDNPRDFIDLYLTEMKNKTKNDKFGSSFNEDQLMALCSDVFSAGVETGSSTVSFAILLVTLHPDVMTKIHKELDSVVGHNRLPSLDDQNELVYTDATLTEVMRLRGAAPLTVPHKAIKDTTLQGHRIPAETVIMNNLYSIQMDRDYWGDPDIFRPERFINPDGSIRRDERMIPFGKGRRACLGESLARMTVYLLFASLMQKFSFSLDPSVPVPNTEGKAGFTLGPPDFKVFAKSRF